MWALLLGGGALVVLLIVLLQRGSPVAVDPTRKLVMYTAAGMRIPVEEIARNYKDEYGVVVELQFGGSEDLLNSLKTNQFAAPDLYLAADDYHTDQAVELGLAAETIPVAHQRPVIAVRNDSGKAIDSLDDLLQDDVTVSVANPNGAAIGRAVKRLLEEIEVDGTTRWAQLEAHVTRRGVFKGTVNDSANDVKIGAVDAAIVWDSTVAMPKYADELRAIPVPELDDPCLISVAVLNSSTNPTSALRFARYLTARDKGLPVFTRYGSRPVEGDVWSERPGINFYCGAVNRRAIEAIVEEFAAREGVDVNTIYDGCGTLTGRMKNIDAQRPELGFPDVYMACDVYYLENVRDWFQEAANVSDVEIVIAVPKGNTRVQSIDDLVAPGVRVAIGQPEQCTIGALTRRLLEEEGLYERLKEKQAQAGEVVVEKASSALLVPDVVTGHVDACVAYISDVLANRDRVDIVRIESPLNRAVQPFSIARSSDHKHLVRRLFKRVIANPAAFEEAGFHFRLDDEHGDAEGDGSP